MAADDGTARLIATDGVPTVVLKGELGLDVDNEIRACFHRGLATGATELRLDLGEVTFLDSHILGILAGTVKQMQERGGEMVVVRASSIVRRVFDITGLSEATGLRTKGDGDHELGGERSPRIGA